MTLIKSKEIISEAISVHCEKYRNFTYFPGAEILRKGTEFQQNFHTRKLGEIAVFVTVVSIFPRSSLLTFKLSLQRKTCSKC